MVAITVILAAVIAAFVFGLAGTTGSAKSVGLTVTMGNNTADDPNVGVITIQGGTDLNQLNQLNYTISGSDTAYVTTGDGTTRARGSYNVGELVYTGDDPINGKRLIVTGYFQDGSSQVLFDKQF